MKASHEFVLLSLLVAFSWESPLNAQPPKQSVRQVDLEEDSITRRAISEDSGCYDQSPSCSYWALTGQCDANPNLQRSCCVWCNHVKNPETNMETHSNDRVKGPLDYPITDEEFEAVINKLKANKSPGLQFVKNYKCHDRYANCYNWATRNECYKNPAYMFQFCCDSCRDVGIIVPW